MGEIALVRAAGRPKHAVVILLVLLACYPLVPQGSLRQLCYDLFGAACVAVGLWGACAIRTAARRGWIILLCGFGASVAGDVLFSVEQELLHLDFYPVPSDALYLGSYVLLGAGMLRLVQGRQARPDPGALLDALIVAAGFAIVVGTFFVLPAAQDSSLNLAGRLVASAYPAGDVVIMAMLVRLWSGVPARTHAFKLLLFSLVALLAADLAWNVIAMSDPHAETPAWTDLLWLLGYLSAATAACSRSAAALSGAGPQDEPASPRRTLTLTAVTLLLPGLTLLVDGLIGEPIAWGTISVGSVVLSALVLVRLRMLLVMGGPASAPPTVEEPPERQVWEIELYRSDVRGMPTE